MLKLHIFCKFFGLEWRLVSYLLEFIIALLRKAKKTGIGFISETGSKFPENQTLEKFVSKIMKLKNDYF